MKHNDHVQEFRAHYMSLSEAQKVPDMFIEDCEAAITLCGHD